MADLYLDMIKFRRLELLINENGNIGVYKEEEKWWKKKSTMTCLNHNKKASVNENEDSSWWVNECSSYTQYER